MTILSSIPIEFISQALNEFNEPAAQKLHDEFFQTPSYQEAIIELSKLHEIVRIHPPEVALVMLNEQHTPADIIKLLMQRATTEASQHQKQHKYAWRLDQSVPNVQAILLNITDCNTNEMKTMRMDLSTFHKLRYNVSLLIKEHAGLEKRVTK